MMADTYVHVTQREVEAILAAIDKALGTMVGEASAHPAAVGLIDARRTLRVRRGDDIPAYDTAPVTIDGERLTIETIVEGSLVRDKATGGVFTVFSRRSSTLYLGGGTFRPLRAVTSYRDPKAILR